MRKIIAGLDLSLSSTGITLCFFEDDKLTHIKFFKVVFDKKPRPITNVNILSYNIPKYIDSMFMVIDPEDKNNVEQLHYTIKSSQASNKINKIIFDNLKEFKPDLFVCVIENYIMPDYGGSNQLKIVSALISLQAFVRKKIMDFCIKNSIILKMLTPTPSNLKKVFSANGNATKEDMVKAFINYYDGEKLIPEIKTISIDKVNDVVDSFALSMYGYKKTLDFDIDKLIINI
jgi:hypothetical protein